MEITDTNLDNIIYENKEELLDYTYIFGTDGRILTKHKIIVIDLDHVRFGISVELNIQSIQSYIFDKDNYFYKFFNKFIDNKRRIKSYITRLRNYLFDDININRMKKHPLYIIQLIRDFN